ncbi:hypothetical protein D3C71_1430130 [compost metagenome]
MVQHPLRCLAVHHRLEEQFKVALDEGLVQPRVPGMLAVASLGSGALFKADPPRIRLVLGARQCFIGQLEQGLRGVAWAVRGKADAGNRVDVAGSSLVQALQGRFKGLGQLYRLLVHHARRKYGELATAAA